MPAIMNCLEEENAVMVGGNTFTFKPNEIKWIYQDAIAHFIVSKRYEQGFVEMPAEFEDKFYWSTPEAVKIIAEKRKDGVANYCRKLRELVYNAEVSLRQDLEKANIKADPKSFASDQDLKNRELLLKYQQKKEDSDQNRIKRLKEIDEKLAALGNE